MKLPCSYEIKLICLGMFGSSVKKNQLKLCPKPSFSVIASSLQCLTLCKMVIRSLASGSVPLPSFVNFGNFGNLALADPSTSKDHANFLHLTSDTNRETCEPDLECPSSETRLDRFFGEKTSIGRAALQAILPEEECHAPNLSNF